MKKRLLSAALALAMVLTMLPLSVMPAFAATDDLKDQSGIWDDSEGKLKLSLTVTWREKDYEFQKASTSNGNTSITAPAAGWYYWGTALSTSDPKVNQLYVASEGVINGTGTSGTWYPDVKKALSSGVSSMKLITDTTTCDVADAKGSSLTIDLDGHTLTLAGELTQENTTTNKEQNTKLTSLTITNSKKTDAGEWPVVSGEITATSQNFSYSAKNTGGTVGTDGPDITVKNDSSNNVTTARTLSVTLTDAVVGDLEVSEGAANIKVTASTKGGAGTGTIKVNEATTDLKNINYGTTTINVSGGEVGAITLNGKTGTGTSGIYLSDMAKAGTITLYGGKANDSSAGAEKQPAWGGSSTVTVGSQCVTGKISVATGNEGAVTVNVTGGSGSTDGVAEIDLSTGAGTTAHTVTVDGGKVGAIKLNAGKLDIKNGANTGAVTLGAGGKTTATISGDKTKVEKVDASASKDITLNISGGTISDKSAAVSLPAGYAKHTITGGSFGSSITEAGWLGSVNYEIKAGDLYTYTSSFQACVDAYKAATKPEITVVGATTSPFDISFILDAPANATNPTPVVVIKTDASHGITLPDKINNKPITTWYIGDKNEPKNAGALMSFSGATQVKATTSSADNSEIVSVKVANDDANKGLSASLVGNTIQVSGALPAGSNGFVEIKLTVKTAIGKEYSMTVSYAVTEKKLVAGSQSAPFAAGTDNASIQIVGTSLIYPLDGSKIVVSAGSIGEVDFENGTAVGTVSVSLGTAEKAALKAQLDGITADFSKSTGVQEAVNKVIAGLSQTQVDNYIRQGRIAAWKAVPGNTGNPNEDQINSQSDYNTLSVVVYLDVRATAWNKTVGQQSMTLNITPYYRLDVVKTNMATGDKAYTVKTGSQLSMAGLTSEYGDVTIDVSKLVGSGLSMAEADWAHHGDYVYKMTDDIKFTTSHGFSPFVLNMVDPAAVVYPDSTNMTADKALGYYDDVQTAIDDTEEGNVVKLHTKYDKTAETYSFSGKARTITFDPGINGTFTPTFSGANVTADKTNGNKWTVQLNEDTAPVNTKVSVSSSGNGTASVNVSTAKPGSTVSGTYTANSGYKAGTFTATAQPGNKSVTVSVSANGTFSFTVPSDATSVTVTPSFVLDTGLPFTDVYATDWYFDGVKYCYNTTNNGYRLMTGLSDTKFGSDRPYERAQVVQILWNMKGRPEPKTTVNPYTDISSIHYAYKAVLWATENNYAEGYPDGTFRPGQSVTREEMVVFLWRAAGKPAGYNSISLNGYTDGWNVHDWGLSAVKWAVALNILSGQNSVSLNGTLAARSTAYRREVAVTVMQFDQKNLF